MNPDRLIDATPVMDDWWLLRIGWDGPAPSPGQWLWLELAGRRCCLPVRDADDGEGWIAGILPGRHLPGRVGPGTPAARSTLQGEPITVDEGDRLLLVGEDLGIGPALALAERHPQQVRLALLGGHQGVPARLVPSRFFIPGLADSAIAGISSLEQAGVPARVALGDDRPGVFQGSLMELLGRYLSDVPWEDRAALRLIAFGAWGELHQCRQGLTTSVGTVELVELPGIQERG